MNNRILNGIAKATVLIASKKLTPEKTEELRKTMDMELMEYCRFQELKSAATGTKLTLDEAMTIYGFLGNTPDHFNKQSLPVKYVLTEVFASLLKPA